MQTWVDKDLYSLDTPVDCGPITVEFFNDDLTAVDPAIFTKNADFKLADPHFADPSFVTQYQEDVALVGDNSKYGLKLWRLKLLSLNSWE